MKRDAVLDAAKELINGDRAKDYGDAYQNHARIADGWNVILKGALQTHGDLTPAHVVLMMDWVKAGYTALGAEIAERDSRPVEQIIEDANGPTTNGDVPAKK